jgi:ABC-type transporter Mla subunit MlaD
VKLTTDFFKMRDYLTLLFLLMLCTCMQDRSRKVFLKAETVQGLNESSAVVYRGYEIGKIRNIRIHKNSVLIELKLRHELEIPVDSKFKAQKVDFFGDKEIVVFLGNENNSIKNGDTLMLSEEVELYSIDSFGVKLKDFLLEIIESVDKDSLSNE